MERGLRCASTLGQCPKRGGLALGILAHGPPPDGPGKSRPRTRAMRAAMKKDTRCTRSGRGRLAGLPYPRTGRGRGSRCRRSSAARPPCRPGSMCLLMMPPNRPASGWRDRLWYHHRAEGDQRHRRDHALHHHHCAHGAAGTSSGLADKSDPAIAGKTTYTYDTVGRVTAITAPPDGVEHLREFPAPARWGAGADHHSTRPRPPRPPPWDYAGQVKQVTAQVNTDPDRVLANYAYDQYLAGEGHRYPHRPGH